MNPVTAILLLTLMSTFMCYFVAKQRGAKASRWVVLGAALGPLAVPFAFFAKPQLATLPISDATQ